MPLNKILIMLNLKNKVICFTLTNILSFDEKIVEAKKEDVKIRPSEKWKYCESIPLRYLLSKYHRPPLLHMANNMAIDEKEIR